MDTSRSTLLGNGLAGLAAVFLAACTQLPPTVTPTPQEGAGPTADPSASALELAVLNTELAVGTERIRLLARSPEGVPIGPDYDLETVFYRIVGEGQALEAASGPSQYFGRNYPDGGSWVVYAPFDSSGTWGLEAIATKDGWTGRGRINIEVSGRPSAPKVGDQPPMGDTPTAPEDELHTVSTDPAPIPGLYAMTVEAAAASGRPSVIVFGSPEHCETALCGPVLQAIKGLMGTYGDRVNFIHVETHDLNEPSQLSTAARAWGLPSEPWVFLLGKRGRIAVRAEGGLDPQELVLLLDRELAAP